MLDWQTLEGPFGSERRVMARLIVDSFIVDSFIDDEFVVGGLIEPERESR